MQMVISSPRQPCRHTLDWASGQWFCVPFFQTVCPYRFTNNIIGGIGATINETVKMPADPTIFYNTMYYLIMQ